MRLESVEELKIMARAHASELGLEQVTLGGPAAATDLESAMRGLSVSLGVAVTPRANDYLLALRLRANTRRHRAFEEEVRKIAKNEVDVRYTGPVRAIGGCPGGPAVLVPLAIGASIGHEDVAGGTVGFFARRRSDGRVGLVSNNHVIANEDLGRRGDRILHPSVCDGRDGSSRIVARLTGNYPRLGTRFRNVDCAFALLENGVPFDASLLDDGSRLRRETAGATDNMPVFKIGRTTRRTAGRIRAFNFDRVEVKRYRFGFPVVFRGQIEIESATNQTFSDPGDSGSIVFDSANRPVGLLFAETAAGGAGNLGLQYANPIDAVLNELRVDILA